MSKCRNDSYSKTFSKLYFQLRREMTNHRVQERLALQKALKGEGAAGELLHCVRFGVAFHHAGLAGEERGLLEQAYR